MIKYPLNINKVKFPGKKTQIILMITIRSRKKVEFTVAIVQILCTIRSRKKETNQKT